MDTPLVTIIIPVYNAERFLRPCLESILAQQYNHWELIVINDGSQDHSVSILEEYAYRDDRIKVISKMNENSGASRVFCVLLGGFSLSSPLWTNI